MSAFFTNEIPAPAPEGSELVATVYDPLQVMMIRGLLESQNIPFMIRERGSGAYISIIMGTNYLGTDVYVPFSCVDRALEVIAPLFEGEEDCENADEETEELDGSEDENDEEYSHED